MPGKSVQKEETLSALQSTITTLEGRVEGFEGSQLARSFETAGQTIKPWSLGAPELDRYLPNGLAMRGVHDITPHAGMFTPAATRFAHCLVERLIVCTHRAGPLVWVQLEACAREHGRAYGPGLVSGLPYLADRLLVLRVHRQRDLAQTVEEAVRTSSVAAVISEGGAAPFKAVQRIDRASQTSGVPCLMVHGDGVREASSAMTRWMLRPARGPGQASDGHNAHAPSCPSFHLHLSRIRGHPAPGDDTVFHVLWNSATSAFDLVSPLRHGQAHGDGSAQRTLQTGWSAQPKSAERFKHTG